MNISTSTYLNLEKKLVSVETIRRNMVFQKVTMTPGLRGGWRIGGCCIEAFVHLEGRCYIKCPCLSSLGGWGDTVGSKLVHIIVECPLVFPVFQSFMLFHCSILFLQFSAIFFSV